MKKLRTILTMLLIAIVVSSSMAQTSQEYAVDDIAGFQTDLAAGTYDVYILTTSGGVYDLTSLVTITSDVVIKAAEDLAEKPVIMRTNSTGVGAGVIRTQTNTVNIGLEGLIFDGTVTGADKVVAFRAESTAHFSVNHCVFRNFTDVNGVFRLQGAESSIDLHNSVFHDNLQRIIHPWEVNVSYGHINIDNCLFYDIDGPVVWFRSTGGGANLAQGTTLTVNHSTFHNINTNADGVFRGRDNNTGEVKILNSVFTNIADTRPLTNGIMNLTVDQCYVGSTSVGSADNDPVITNLFITTPVYEDADNFNFEITNADDFIVAGGDVAGVVWYYPPRVHPDLLVENDNQVKLTFSRPVDQATAEIATNYDLSGTFGLTGNPTEATLDGDREVLLTVGDISDMPLGETIIVTVTGVEDTYGMMVADNNVATYTRSGFPVTFTVTFDDNGTPAPLEDAEITITGVAGTLTTDEDGIAVIALENGTYTYSVDAVDYIPLEDLTFEVDDDALDVPVTMLPIPEPTLTMASQEVTNRPGQTVTGSSDKTGFIVIVHEDAPQSTLAEIMAAIDADMAASADVETPNENVAISTGGLEPGVYNGYAVDQNDVISDPIMAVVTVIDFQSSEYTVDEIARLQTDLAAGTYDEFVLTTSGGEYDLTTYINLNGSRTIRGAEGLAEKPVISRSNNTNTFAAIILVTGDNATITLENLIFDGTVTSDDPAHTIAGIRANSTVHVDADNCVFRNIANINGAFRLQGAGTTVDVRNSVFHDILDRIIHLFSPNEVYGHVNIDNCIFYNLNGSVVYSRTVSGESAIQSSLTVNHSTFHNITPGNDGVFRGRGNAVGETQILNSVFTNIPAPLAVQIPNTTVDYCYVATMNPVPEGTNLFTIAPVYEDADNFNFKITNEDDFIVGGGDLAGVVWYYPPRVHPDLLVENDNQVKLTFSRQVVEATAEIATNYALSGTFGLTGNPTAATMISDREVLLTVGDISDVPEDETIIVTVTGVEDTYGMEIGPNNVATYTSTIIIIPEEYLVTFTVTFDDEGTPEPVEGAQITITGIEGTLVTDAEGVATIELENGTYTYNITATGYVSVVDASFVVEDEPVNVDVTLELTPIPDEPTLTMSPQEVSNREGQTVTGSSDKVGFIAIVRENAPQSDLAEILAAIDTDLGASAEVTTPGETVSISTAGLQPGIYNGYAVDADDNISEAVMAVVTINDPHSREYTVDQIAQLQPDLATGAYDVYILTTSGGVYDLTSQITITSDAVIKAAEGLAEKPVIQRSSNTSGSQGIFRIQTNTVSIVLEGLIFDGMFSEPGTASPMGFRAESTTHFTVNDCVFRNFDNSNGVFRLDVGGSSIDVRNSFFHDCKERVIHLYTPDEVYGDVNIDNCLFYNINGTVVFYRSSSGVTAIGTNLRVNHSTFHNIKIANANDGVIRGRDNNTGETLILNSVFTEIEDNWPIIRGFLNNPVVDYCYFGTNSPHTGGGPIVTNTFTTTPVYEDAENAIFRISNADDFLVASGDIAGVVWYYPPRVNPDLLIENNTHVKVVFNRPVEVASAENAANYELSGTFGLTGNPASALLVNEREVLLAVSDISSISSGQTIIVTVTGVADTYGMVVEDNNVATYAETTPVDLEVFMESQTVSNAEGQFVLVQSSFPDGFVYIVLEGEPQATKEQLDAAVAAGKGAFAEVTAAMVDIEISTFNLHPGAYFAYAVSTDGDLSDPSTNSITVTDDDTSTEDILADQIKIFSSNYIIYVKAPLSLHGVGFEVFDLSGRKIYAGELDGDNQIETRISGIYIVRVLHGLHRPVKIVVGW